MSISTKNITYICPICGYPFLVMPPFTLNEIGYGSDDICPCCFNEFGFDLMKPDIGVILELRQRWINNGYQFHGGAPAEWDPIKQLENIKKINIMDSSYVYLDS